ncbi:Protein extra-macrochaetae [Halotydeus destructor]|nr:Protein extra-macrochaetae [Halotydeus destructor]
MKSENSNDRSAAASSSPLSSSGSPSSQALPLKPKSFGENKVKKSKTPTRVQEEMQELLLKLQDLVPNMPKNKKMSKLEIIQSVIDYIFDLQTALESHPLRLRHQSLALQALALKRAMPLMPRSA